MSMAEIMAENRRLIMLRALDESGYAANETVLKSVVETFGHHPSRDMIRADFTFLAEHGLIRLEKLAVQSGDLWVAHLLTPGQEVAKGRVHPGVARREPG
jgi:hypothetical protein